jgi:hypothetical protein
MGEESERRRVMEVGDVITEGPFEGFEVIHTYSRADAIGDGVLVDVTEEAREAGLVFPVAVTRTVWEGYVTPSLHDKEKWGQDLVGRLWDTLWMLRMAVKGGQGEYRADSGELRFEVYYRLQGHARRIPLKAVFGLGDDGSPVITVMLPDED